MAYDNNRFSVFDNFYSDGCGCKNEKKYYCNGTYIDLCGLSIEEYMKPQCCCGGNSNDGDSVKPLNEIFVKSFKDDNGDIYYQAFSKFAVTSNIKINILCMDNTLTVLDLYVGDVQTTPERGETEDFSTITLSSNEDDNYRYIVSTESSKTINDIYFHTMLLSDFDSFNDNFNVISMGNGTTSNLMFVIPATDINCNDMEIEELDEFCQANQHCLILCLPKSIYDKNGYSINTLGGDIITSKFELSNTVTINNIEYVFLVDKAIDDIAPYVPLYKEELVYEYKLTINK